MKIVNSNRKFVTLAVVPDMMSNKINDRRNPSTRESGGIASELWPGATEEFILVLSDGGHSDYCWRVEETVPLC